jgi:hypothetical protein
MIVPIVFQLVIIPAADGENVLLGTDDTGLVLLLIGCVMEVIPILTMNGVTTSHLPLPVTIPVPSEPAKQGI